MRLYLIVLLSVTTMTIFSHDNNNRSYAANAKKIAIIGKEVCKQHFCKLPMHLYTTWHSLENEPNVSLSFRYSIYALSFATLLTWITTHYDACMSLYSPNRYSYPYIACIYAISKLLVFDYMIIDIDMPSYDKESQYPCTQISYSIAPHCVG